MGDRETRSAIEDSARETGMRGGGTKSDESGFGKWFERFLFGWLDPSTNTMQASKQKHSLPRSTIRLPTRVPPIPMSARLPSEAQRSAEYNTFRCTFGSI